MQSQEKPSRSSSLLLFQYECDSFIFWKWLPQDFPFHLLSQQCDFFRWQVTFTSPLRESKWAMVGMTRCDDWGCTIKGSTAPACFSWALCSWSPAMRWGPPKFYRVADMEGNPGLPPPPQLSSQLTSIINKVAMGVSHLASRFSSPSGATPPMWHVTWSRGKLLVLYLAHSTDLGAN